MSDKYPVFIQATLDRLVEKTYQCIVPSWIYASTKIFESGIRRKQIIKECEGVKYDRAEFVTWIERSSVDSRRLFSSVDRFGIVLRSCESDKTILLYGTTVDDEPTLVIGEEPKDKKTTRFSVEESFHVNLSFENLVKWIDNHTTMKKKFYFQEEVCQAFEKDFRIFMGVTKLTFFFLVLTVICFPSVSVLYFLHSVLSLFNTSPVSLLQIHWITPYVFSSVLGISVILTCLCFRIIYRFIARITGSLSFTTLIVLDSLLERILHCGCFGSRKKVDGPLMCFFYPLLIFFGPPILVIFLFFFGWVAYTSHYQEGIVFYSIKLFSDGDGSGYGGSSSIKYGDPGLLMDGVIELTPDNVDMVFDDSVTDVFVEIYAPWCTHCKKLAPEMEKLGKEFIEGYDGDDIIIGKVNCDEYRDTMDICVKHGDTELGFPSLNYYKSYSLDEETQERSLVVSDVYTGGDRTFEGIAVWMNTLLYDEEKRGAGKYVFDIEVAKKYALEIYGEKLFDKKVLEDLEKNVLVKFYAPWCGHCKHLEPEYEAVAKALVNDPDCIMVSVDATNHKNVAEKYDVTGYPTLKFFGKGGKNKETPESFFSRDRFEILEFMNEKCGTSRNMDGTLDNGAGLLKKMNIVVRKYRATSDDKVRERFVKRAEKESSGFSGREKEFAEYYLEVMGEIRKEGNEWVESELERLEKLYELEVGDDVATSKEKDELKVRINILKVF